MAVFPVKMRSAAEGFTVHMQCIFVSAEIFKLQNETKNFLDYMCFLNKKTLIHYMLI
jgi:hypothetical protein